MRKGDLLESDPAEMLIIEQAELSDVQKARIIELWNAEYPISLVYPSVGKFDEYLDGLPGKRHFLMVDGSGSIEGWAMTFDRDSGRWFAIIIDGRVQGHGLGAMLMDHLTNVEGHLYGWVIDHSRSLKLNGERYLSPLGFYTRIGFRVVPDVRIESDRMSGVKIEWGRSRASRLP